MPLLGLLTAASTLCFLLSGLTQALCHPKQTCPMGARPNSTQDEQLADLFPGLFSSGCTSQSLEQHSFKLTKFQHIRTLQNITISQQDGPPGKRELSAHARGSKCCKRRDSLVKPISVRFGEHYYDAVHLENRPQLLTVSECARHNSRCQRYKRCKPYYLIQWILVNDPDLAEDYTPPVRFVPVKISSGCHCVSIYG